jgi:hypothetical protein
MDGDEMASDLEITPQDVQSLDATAKAIELALIGGDLSKLSAAERVSYYNRTCHSLGLNRLTRPFDYLNLNGKLVLYARKDCTEQLRKINVVSVDALQHDYRPELGVYVVTAIGHDKHGRHDAATGAVAVGASTKGEVLANLVMKAETKAKRRLTLSICGLGMLDEAELDTMPSDALPMGTCNRCGKEGSCLPNEVVCEECAPKKLPAMGEVQKEEPKPEPKAEKPSEALNPDKEKLIQDFIAALTQLIPASEARQRVGQEILGCKTLQEMRKMSLAKLNECGKVLVELGERMKKENVTNAEDLVALVNMVRER